MWNWVYICRHNSYKLKGNSESCLRCCATHKTARESAFVYTHTHADIISFSVGYCCHRQCFLLLHLYSLETRNGWKMITGESAVCVILSFHCSFPLFSCFSPHHILTAQPVFLSFSWTDLALFDLHVIQIHKNLNNKRWQCISCSLSVTCAPFSLALWQLCDVGLLSVLKAQLALAPGGRVIWWMKQPQLIRWVFSAGLAWVDRCDHYSGVCLPTGSVCVFWLLRFSQLTSVKTSRAPRLPPDTSERSECSLWQVL